MTGTEKAKIVTNNEDNKKVELVGSIPKDSVIEFEPEPFSAIGKTTRIASDVLTRMIRMRLQSVFHDLVGVVITPPINGNFGVELYFEDNKKELEDNKIKNLVNLTAASKGASIYDRKQALNNKIAGATFALNDETKLLLSDIMYGGRENNLPNNKKNWEKNAKQVQFPISPSDGYAGMYRMNPISYRVYVRVTGIDFRRVLGLIFGNTMVVKTVYDEATKSYKNFTGKARYEARLMKTRENGVFMINIEQFDEDAVREINLMENPNAYFYNMQGLMFY